MVQDFGLTNCTFMWSGIIVAEVVKSFLLAFLWTEMRIVFAYLCYFLQLKRTRIQIVDIFNYWRWGEC